jgi:hypothetical protein
MTATIDPIVDEQLDVAAQLATIRISIADQVITVPFVCDTHIAYRSLFMDDDDDR